MMTPCKALKKVLSWKSTVCNELHEYKYNIDIRIIEPRHNAVILHEDKQYYPSASDVYGQDVETLVQEEDAHPLTEPIVAPIKTRKWVVEEKDLPETRFDKGYVPRPWMVE